MTAWTKVDIRERERHVRFGSINGNDGSSF